MLRTYRRVYTVSNIYLTSDINLDCVIELWVPDFLRVVRVSSRCPLPGASEPTVPAASVTPIQSAPVVCSPGGATGQHCSPVYPCKKQLNQSETAYPLLLTFKIYMFFIVLICKQCIISI